MFELKKIAMTAVLLVSVASVSACNSVLFPEYDENEEEVYVGEGGRVIRAIPAEGDSLQADVKNQAYEEDENTAEVKTAKAEIPAEDKAEPAATTAVERAEAELAAGEAMLPQEEKLSEDVKAEVAAANRKPEEVAELADLMNEPAGPSVSYRIDTFLFENGSAVLDDSSRGRISEIVKEAKAHDAQVVVYGYASSRTRNTDAATHKLANFKVSMERANAVAAALKRAGLPAKNIEVIAMSDSAPIYQEVMPEGERLNRRAEVYVSY